ncbi:MAG: dinitrogenase iron-molybdenum cofactor biosynthesis protein [Pseudodesulfovibrio sp.]|jgi:predicted Fe-Mo cluster-binding NifX family protein|nr:dinitrogenase iron-molybdenum cofactor biosynthesis protein [Pseudodesulfovibrio sp.]
MDICITGYQNRVATLLETATELRLYSLEGLRVVRSGMTAMPTAGACILPTYLKSMGVEIVICGGLSKAVQDGFEALGIQVISWVKGPIEVVLTAYLEDKLDTMIMPGRTNRNAF